MDKQLSDILSPQPLKVTLSTLWLTFLQTGEGQRVLAHKLALEEGHLVTHAEADEAELRDSDAKVHVGVPVRSQSWSSKNHRY